MASLEDLLVGSDARGINSRLQEVIRKLEEFKPVEKEAPPGKSGQMVPIRCDQVMNDAGGFVFQISDEAFVRRFLILGTTGGTYYVSEKELTMRAAAKLCDIVERGKGLMLMREIVEISLAGRAPKQDPTLFALALCARYQVRDTTSKHIIVPSTDTMASKAEGDQKADTGEKDSAEKNNVDYRQYALLMDANYQKALQQLAFFTVPKVCRIPTHLFMFIKYCKLVSAETGVKVSSKGWGRALRATVSNWYLSQNPKRLVMQVTKYRNREGYTHRDLFRLSHVHPSSALPADHEYWKHHTEYDAIFKYIIEGDEDARKRKQKLHERFLKKRKLDNGEGKDTISQWTTGQEEEMMKKMAKLKLEKEKEMALMEKMKSKDAPSVETSEILQFLTDFEKLKKLTVDDADQAVQLIKKHDFVREHVPAELLNNREVWEALLVKMPMTAMIRNLGKMTAVGLLNQEEKNMKYVRMAVSKLEDERALKEARVHPLAVLLAKATYGSGGGFRGKNTWTPNKQIEDALEHAFYASFHNVAPTNKRYCLALDVSGSMTCPLSGSALTCREAAAALLMTFVRTESQVRTVAFSDHLVPFELNREMKLNKVISITEQIPMGGTDCALPMIWATEKKLPFDVFIVYTDSETWFGDVHPFVALQNYRKKMSIPDAKLIVMGMTATEFSIADPSDPNMLDICGLDSSVPELVKEFVCGNLS